MREEDVRMLMEEVNICNPVAGIAGSDDQMTRFHITTSLRPEASPVEVFRLYVSGHRVSTLRHSSPLPFLPRLRRLLLTFSTVFPYFPYAYCACHVSISKVCNAQP